MKEYKKINQVYPYSSLLKEKVYPTDEEIEFAKIHGYNFLELLSMSIFNKNDIVDYVEILDVETHEIVAKYGTYSFNEKVELVPVEKYRSVDYVVNVVIQ